MQSIETKYVGPTNSRGSRVKATASGGFTLTIEWDDALNTDENHSAAARALINKLGWFHEPGDTYGEWFYGDRKDGSRIWVCTVAYAKLVMDVAEEAEAK